MAESSFSNSSQGRGAGGREKRNEQNDLYEGDVYNALAGERKKTTNELVEAGCCVESMTRGAVLKGCSGIFWAEM